ncbi:MAG: SURF1 family protein [Anaerolineae bacterium]|nr:SURF1 family protein [Anaerolineae bacterium]
MAVMVRLGKWQLDRLEQRRAFNARVSQQVELPRLLLDADAAELDLYAMEYRKVVLHGEYDFSKEIALRNRAFNNRFGVELFTPLMIEGSQKAVLVNRGWIPIEESAPEDWHQYQVDGVVTVQGIIRRAPAKPDYGTMQNPTKEPDATRLEFWNIIEITRIAEENDLELLPVYILPEAVGEIGVLPATAPFELELTEGPHAGYALQWFAFATTLLIGYPFFVKKQKAESINKV